MWTRRRRGRRCGWGAAAAGGVGAAAAAARAAGGRNCINPPAAAAAAAASSSAQCSSKPSMQPAIAFGAPPLADPSVKALVDSSGRRARRPAAGAAAARAHTLLSQHSRCQRVKTHQQRLAAAQRVAAWAARRRQAGLAGGAFVFERRLSRFLSGGARVAGRNGTAGTGGFGFPPSARLFCCLRAAASCRLWQPRSAFCGRRLDFFSFG